MTKEIQLTQGKVALVDDDLYEYLSQWDWCAHYMGGKSGGWYAYRVVRSQENKRIYMHRFIALAPDKMEIDHRDGNGLNNQRANLRVCERFQNARNRRIHRNNTSGFKGVCRKHGRWVAQIRLKEKYLHIGVFDDPETAARAYDQKAREYYGEFAKTNFPAEVAS